MGEGDQFVEGAPGADGAGAPRPLCPIVLVGLMGAGKTSVGKRLAARLAVPFRDSDEAVVEAAGLSIPEIFAELGEAAFRDGERRVIARLLRAGPGVLATGGGAFLDAGTRAAIGVAGVSVWLRADLETLWARVGGKPGRPLLDGADPRGRLAALMEARYPVYGEAEVTVETKGQGAHEHVASRIIAALAARDQAVAPERRVFA
ncbi:MAG: shikimate kinase [Pseudomonadota bacterium]